VSVTTSLSHSFVLNHSSFSFLKSKQEEYF